MPAIFDDQQRLYTDAFRQVLADNTKTSQDVMDRMFGKQVQNEIDTSKSLMTIVGDVLNAAGEQSSEIKNAVDAIDEVLHSVAYKVDGIATKPKVAGWIVKAIAGTMFAQELASERLGGLDTYTASGIPAGRFTAAQARAAQAAVDEAKADLAKSWLAKGAGAVGAAITVNSLWSIVVTDESVELNGSKAPAINLLGATVLRSD